MLEREHSVGAGTKKVPGATLTRMHWETRPSQWEGSGGGQGCEASRRAVNRWSLTARVVAISQDLQDTPGRCHLLSKWGWPVHRPPHGPPQTLHLLPTAPAQLPPPSWWDLVFLPAPWNSPWFSPCPMQNPPPGPECGDVAPTRSTCRRASSGARPLPPW